MSEVELNYVSASIIYRWNVLEAFSPWRLKFTPTPDQTLNKTIHSETEQTRIPVTRQNTQAAEDLSYR